MKRALVITLLVFGLGIGVAAQSFSGSWATDITFTVDPFDIASLTSILDVDYTISGWTFGANLFINQDELFDINFAVGGVLGAFAMYSWLDFDPTGTPEFTSWENVATVSIAGVSLYGVFVLQDTTGLVGTGFAIGGYGTAGDVSVWIEADFNVGGKARTLHDYGFGYATDWETYYECIYATGWTSGAWGVQTEGCTATFSNLDIIIDVPLACLDFVVQVNFDCTNGFDYIQFDLNDIDLGAGWFQLDDLNIKFTTVAKTVTTDFTATFGDAVCVTPYFDLVQGFASIDGIELDALLLSYSYNGVTFKAGELFPSSGNYYVGFTKSGALSHYTDCVVSLANEFVGIWFDGDSCCGGLTSASLVTFFVGNQTNASSPADDGTHGIFDFLLIVGNVEVGIGSGFSIRAGFELSAATGLDYISGGFTFSF
ncbi:hypothetical protein ACFLS0_02290 [Candidatus Bipolaricaulota bacterium]